MKLLKKFQTEEQYLAFANSKAFVEPNTSLVVGTDTVKFNSDRPDYDYSQDYFTIEAVDNTVSISLNKSISYSLDDGNTWITPGEGSGSGSGGSYDIGLSRGQHCLFKYEKDSTIDYQKSVMDWSISGKFKVYGNIMSLFVSDNFYSSNSFDVEDDIYIFQELFATTDVTDASNLILPATTLANNCYCSMFSGCTYLEKAPSLPATTLANNCYDGMFQGCTSLTTAPDLLALDFEGSCYQTMFYGCTSLNYIKCLADCQPHVGYSYELRNWTYNVAENGTFVKSSNVQIEPTRWEYGSDGIPVGWTVINE